MYRVALYMHIRYANLVAISPYFRDRNIFCLLIYCWRRNHEWEVWRGTSRCKQTEIREWIAGPRSQTVLDNHFHGWVASPEVLVV